MWGILSQGNPLKGTLLHVCYYHLTATILPNVVGHVTVMRKVAGSQPASGGIPPYGTLLAIVGFVGTRGAILGKG